MRLRPWAVSGRFRAMILGMWGVLIQTKDFYDSDRLILLTDPGLGKPWNSSDLNHPPYIMISSLVDLLGRSWPLGRGENPLLALRLSSGSSSHVCRGQSFHLGVKKTDLCTAINFWAQWACLNMLVLPMCLKSLNDPVTLNWGLFQVESEYMVIVIVILQSLNAV